MELNRICNCCKKKYSHPLHYKYSTERKEYTQYLGYCSDWCYCEEYLKEDNTLALESLRAFFNELKLKKKLKKKFKIN